MGLYDKPLRIPKRTSRRVFESRLFRVDWETKNSWRPWLMFHAGFGGSLRGWTLTAGSLHARWSPWTREDWAKAVADGTRPRWFRIWGPRVEWFLHVDGDTP